MARSKQAHGGGVGPSRFLYGSAVVVTSAMLLSGCAASDPVADASDESASVADTQAPSAEVTETLSPEPTSTEVEDGSWEDVLDPDEVVTTLCTDQELVGPLGPSDEPVSRGVLLTSFEATPTFACGAERETKTTGHLREMRARQVLSADMTKIAVNWADSTDSSKRVGILDLRTGEVTEVSEKMSGTGGDFAAVPQHSNALFAPDGTFVYYDHTTETFHWIDPESMQEVRSGSREEQYDSNGTSWWAGPEAMQSTDNMSGLNFAKSIVINSDGDEATVKSGFRALDWHDANSFLIIKDGRLGIWDLTSGEDPEDDESVVRYITPASDFSISTAVTTEDLKHVRFLATRGYECALFEVPADGSAEPTKMTDLPSCDGYVFIRQDLPAKP